LQEKAGVDAGRLAAIGYGEYRPIADNDSRANRARNRRVEIRVLPIQ
jgi:chemotaxis protein MotB